MKEKDEPESDTAERPSVAQPQVDGQIEGDHCNGVVEEAQHKDGVDAVGRAAHEEIHVRGNLHVGGGGAGSK